MSYVPARHRSALAALFAIDAAMGDALRATIEPALGEIKLVWWHDRLVELDSLPPPAEPRLQAVSAGLMPHGIAGREIAPLANGWRRLLDPFPWNIQVAEAIWFRGRFLFALGARILSAPSEDIEAAGGLWALADAARHCSDGPSRQLLLGQTRTFSAGIRGARFPAALRPLSMLGSLAMRDANRGEPFEAEGSPARVAVMLAHRLTGKT